MGKPKSISNGGSGRWPLDSTGRQSTVIAVRGLSEAGRGIKVKGVTLAAAKLPQLLDPPVATFRLLFGTSLARFTLSPSARP
jgi:hypothetical protein